MLRKGQALIVVLLILAVATTIGLAAVSRSVTEINLASGGEDSAKALAAAESGVEAVLGGQPLPTGADYTLTVNSGVYGAGATTGLLQPLLGGESGTIWLADQGGANPYSGTSVDICWGQSAASPLPAIETTLFYKNGGNLGIVKQAYDPDGTRRGSNNFSVVNNNGTCPTDKSYVYSQRIVLNMPGGATAVSMRVKLFYNTVAQYVGARVVGAGAVFPNQGISVDSSAQVGTNNRKVTVNQGYPEAWSQFDAAVFSGGDLYK